ncbi:PTS ascorbate transporter subunit IIB [Jeongeupia sp. HS-3]|uniref:PTS sugar transporter subunit IIB n=1 Tax=Jeongeupia sp. HS-3 TaxID=1009682 RepID=UPI0018A47CDC|nr:PTS sugar transporter subunit IIB [Jeongeupia sp. HS-3]BCL75307.1 PTS ascorbate transporter subunit IIB [Jeongeupia sp. HS-3]
MKILIVCGNGLGSSLMLEMAVKEVLRDLGSDAEVAHTDLFSSRGETADLFLGSREIIDNLDDGTRTVASLKNIMDKAEIKSVLVPHLS